MSQVSSIGAGGSGTGDVVGPASSTDNAVVRFDGITGKLIQNSLAILSDAGALSGLTQLDVDNIDVNGNTISSTDVNGNINLTPNGAGNIVLDGISWPNTGSSTGDILYGSSANALSTLTAPTIPGSQLIWDGTNVSWFNPLKDVWIYEDWVAGGAAGSYTWITSTAGGAVGFNNTANLDASHPGIVNLNTSNSATGAATARLSGAAGQGSILLGGGVLDCYWIMKLDTLSDVTNTYTIRIGLGDNSNADNVAGVYFEYTDGVNSGNWQIKTAANSVRTTTNTSTAVDTNWTTLRINVNADATLCTFYINGSSVGTINTNIPTTNSNNYKLNPNAMIVKSVGTTRRDFFLDKCVLYQKITSNR